MKRRNVTNARLRNSLLFGVVLLAALGFLIFTNFDRQTKPVQTHRPPIRVTNPQPDASNTVRNPAVETDSTPTGNSASFVRGMVADNAGAPIPGAHVRLTVPDNTSVMLAGILHTPAVNETVESDAEGRFAFTGDWQGLELRVIAGAEGFCSVETLIEVPPEGIDGVVLSLQRTAQITGRVLNEKNEGLSGVIVMTHEDGRGYRQSQATGDTGQFVLDELMPGQYGLWARCPPPPVAGLRLKSVEIGSYNNPLIAVRLAAGERRENITVIIPGTAEDRAIRGTVRDEEGHRLPGAVVWAALPNTPGFRPLGIAQQPTDAQGRFEIAHIVTQASDFSLSTKVVDVCASLAGYEPGITRAVPLGVRDLPVVLLPLQRGAIRGIVVDARSDEPVTDAQVMLWQVDTMWGEQWRTSGPEIYEIVRSGSSRVDRQTACFVIDDVQAGNVTLFVSSATYGMSTSRTIEVEAGKTSETRILLPPPGELKITLEYGGLMAGRKAECVIECWPLGQVAQVPSFSPELQRIVQGDEPLSESEVEASVYSMRVAPGSYEIHVKTSAWVDAGASYSSNYVRRRAEVNSGQVKELTVDVGGSGLIDVSVDTHSGEKAPLLVLTPESDATFLRDFDPTTDEGRAAIVERFGQAMFAYCLQGCPCEFTYIPPGTYQLTVYGRAEDDGTVYIRDSKSVLVKTDEVTFVDSD